MNEEWLNKIHDRMAGYETDEPNGLWNALESKIEPKQPGKVVWIRVWRYVAAAAMIAVAVTVGVYLARYEHDAPDAKLVAKTDESVETVTESTLAEQTVPETIQVNSSDNVGSLKPLSDNIIAENVSATATEDDPATVRQTTDEHPVVEEKADNREKTAVEKWQAEPGKMHFAEIRPRESSSLRGLSMSIYGAGCTGAALSYNSKGSSFVSALGPGESSWEDNPSLGLLLYNQGKDVATDIKHRLPVRAGVAFAYSIDGRWSVETGVSYSYLASDIREGSEAHYYTGQQKLHYVGVPLNLRYKVLSWKRLDLYASAGVLAEKCVSAKLDKEYVLDNNRKGCETDNLPDKPMQWSVNASAGVQYNLVSSMSVFVEPGISYHFDDGTDISTIYKEKPLNFDLNLGLRFTFGR